MYVKIILEGRDVTCFCFVNVWSLLTLVIIHLDTKINNFHLIKLALIRILAICYVDLLI